MSDQTDIASECINVDLEQWRRDIDTFAAATTSALDAIVSELSTVCSGDQVSSVAGSSSVRATAKPTTVLQHAKNESDSVKAPTAPSSSSRSTALTNGGSRLASLKEKLASRINKV